MKKALAILLALSMVFAAFADAPAADFAVSISGSAELGWQADLEAEKNGFFNNTEVKAKINLFNGGDVATSGDGIWGELKIVTDKDGHKELSGAQTDAFVTAIPSVEMYAKVDTAKIYFKEGDIGVALNLLKPSLNLGDVVLPTATSFETKSKAFNVEDCAPKGNPAEIIAAKADLDAANTALEAAKNDYKALVDAAALCGTAAPNWSEDDHVAAEKAAVDAAQAALEKAQKKDLALSAGFAVEFTSSKVDATIKLLDNGVQKDKEYGFGADVSVKAIENVGLKAGFAYAYETTAFAASADYKYAIDEKYYVKPVVAFAMMDKAKQLDVGVLFGWGADGQKPEFALLNKDSDKFADGVSVTYTNTLAENDKGSITIGLYDSTFVEGLKVGAQYGASLDKFGKGALLTGVKYSKEFIEKITLSGEFGYGVLVGTKDSDYYKYSVEVKSDKVVDNTTVYAKYEGEKDNNGKITVGAKIAL